MTAEGYSTKHLTSTSQDCQEHQNKEQPLVGGAQRLEHGPAHQRVEGSIPWSRARTWVASSIPSPSQGTCGRQPMNVSVSLFPPPLPPSLKNQWGENIFG